MTFSECLAGLPEPRSVVSLITWRLLKQMSRDYHINEPVAQLEGAVTCHINVLNYMVERSIYDGEIHREMKFDLRLFSSIRKVLELADQSGLDNLPDIVFSASPALNARTEEDIEKYIEELLSIPHKK